MELVDAWGAYQETGEDQYWWALDRVDDLMGNDPDACLQFILKVMKQYHQNDKVLSSLAAGPLEDFIHRYGEARLDELYLHARQDPKFNELLGGVWGLEELNAVWAKLGPILNHKW